ncbi:MAG: diaminopimelate decarboxylase, partial [Phycisphaerae bacterium]
MDYFSYKNQKLYCEDVPVEKIAEQVGTPIWIYSQKTLLEHYRKTAEAFAPADGLICFSIKCLSNLSILKLLAEHGSGFDVVSGGEVLRAQLAGADMSKVVFAGVAKTDDEIRLAIDAGIGCFNVESEQEFENISRIAREMGKKTHAALRINPDVFDPKTHAYTTTGKKETKFGVDIDRAEKFYDTYGRDEYVSLDGIDLHIGSPIYSAEPYVAAIKKTLDLIDTLRAKGLEINTLDIGGGYAADYEEGASPAAADYAEEIIPVVQGKGLKLILEPGRSIACNAGILLTKVEYTKQGGEKRFLMVDAAITDLLRPALYQSEHFMYAAELPEGEPAPTMRMDYQAPGAQKVDVVGGVCETADLLGKDRMLPPMERGDLLAVFSSGAYGMVMSSQYNSRPRAAEVLVDGDSYRVVRRR